VEAFDLAVGAWSVGLDGEVADPVAGEQLSERAVLDVGESVVGHHSLGADAVAGKVGEPAFDERCDGGRGLVVVALDKPEA
jgi:hypothetical protein